MWCILGSRRQGVYSIAPVPSANVVLVEYVEFTRDLVHDSRHDLQIVEAFPWDTAPRYLLRDRDGVYGHYFRRRVDGMDIREVPIAPRSPWQNPYVERMIGSIRRECLDHMIVLSEQHLRRIIAAYLRYYHAARTHLSLDKDAPDGRAAQPPDAGKVVALPHLGGLHHEYVRLAA